MWSLDFSCYDDAVRMMIRGLAKCRLRHNCTKLELRVLLDYKLIKALVILCDNSGWHQLSVQIIASYAWCEHSRRANKEQ